MLYILLRSCEEIIDTNDVMAIADQTITQVRSEKSRATRYEDRFTTDHASPFRNHENAKADQLENPILKRIFSGYRTSGEMITESELA